MNKQNSHNRSTGISITSFLLGLITMAGCTQVLPSWTGWYLQTYLPGLNPHNTRTPELLFAIMASLIIGILVMILIEKLIKAIR